MSALLPLAMILAMSRNRCIGRHGTLPWHFPEDLKYFRRMTTGHAIIMGRKTYDSIGRPLPNRRNIVVSRQPGLTIAGCETAPDLSTGIAMARAGGEPEPRIIGGASICIEALPWTTKLFLTDILDDVEGDTFFPALNAADWREIERHPGEDPKLIFRVLERIQ